MRDGKPLPGLSEMTALVLADAGACTVRFKVAAGPWKTIQTWGKNPGSVGGIDASYIFSRAIATKNGTTLSVTHNIQDKPVRVVAVDGDGKVHPAEIRSGGGAANFRQIVVEFDQPPEQIKEFWLQSRPYESVEILGIALKTQTMNAACPFSPKRQEKETCHGCAYLFPPQPTPTRRSLTARMSERYTPCLDPTVA